MILSCLNAAKLQLCGTDCLAEPLSIRSRVCNGCDGIASATDSVFPFAVAFATSISAFMNMLHASRTSGCF